MVASYSDANKKKTRISRLKRNIKKNYQYHLIILVPIIYLIIFKYYPIYGVQIAFKQFKPSIGILGSEWVGLKHFTRFIESPMFERVIGNTIAISLYELIAGFPIPIILALAINNHRGRLFKKTVQMITYAPHFISTVILVGIMAQLLSPKYGIVNQVVSMFGQDPVLFMGDPKYFRHLYVWSGVWQSAGWGTIIYLSALSGIPQSHHEAAIVDGAGRFKRMLYIDIPYIMPTMITLLILRSGRLMNVGFEKALVMQNSTNIMKSEIIATYVYKVGIASSMPNYSYAAAIGLFNSLINFAIIILVNQISKKVSETSLW